MMDELTVESVQTVGNAIDEVGETDPNYTSVRYDRTSRTFHVARIPSETVVEEGGYRHVAPASVNVSFEAARLSRRQISVLSQLVSESRSWLREKGIDVQAWGLAPESDNRFQLFFDGYGHPDAEVLDRFAVFGSDNVCFKRGRVVPL